MKGKGKKFVALALVLSLVVGWNALVNTTMAKYVTSWVQSLNLGILTDGSTIHGETVSNSTVQMTVDYANYGSVVGNAGHEEVGMGFGTGERYDTQVIGVGCRNVYRYLVSDKAGNPLNISGMNYLQFDIWLPKGYSSNKEVLYPNSTDAQRALANAELELGSGGEFDKYELSFDLEQILKIDTPTTKGDWYTVVVDLSQGHERSATPFDPTHLNFFGFYWADHSETANDTDTAYGYDRIGWSVIANMRFVKYATNEPGIHCQNQNISGAEPDPTIRLGTITQGDDTIFDGKYYYHLGNNLYEEVASNADNANNFEDMGKDISKIIVAGEDQDPHTPEDNNKLSGRTGKVAVGHVADIPIDYINREEMFYTIAGVSPLYKVKYGRDKMCGTYDDVITTDGLGSSLGTYAFWSESSDRVTNQNVGWNYLGGPINRMMLTTEYVLGYTNYDTAPHSNVYSDSNLRTIYENLGAQIGVSDAILLKNQSITTQSFTDNYKTVVKITAGSTQEEANQLTYDSASNYWYVQESQVVYGHYTPAPTTPIPASFTATYFPLSVQELTEAYGAGNYDEVRDNRLAPCAREFALMEKEDPSDEDVPHAYYTAVGSDIGLADDGFGEEQYVMGYFLRDPGDTTSNACAVMAYNRGAAAGFHNFAGEVSAQLNIDWEFSGVRPACYVNLSLQDNPYFNLNEYYYLGANIYREKSTNKLITAGQDLDIYTTADNNKLAGKALALANIDVVVNTTTFSTCNIPGLSDDIYVDAGQDAMLGTYDDLICSKSGIFGRRQIAKNIPSSKLRWNFLTGTSIDNMLLTTEYVYAKTTFRDYNTELKDFYAGSYVDDFCDRIFANEVKPTMDADILKTSMIEIGYDSYVGAADTGRAQQPDGQWPSWIDIIYYPTDDPSTPHNDTTGRPTQYNYSPNATLERTFFAASLGELTSAYNGLTAVNAQSYENDRRYRQYLAAPAAPIENENGLDAYERFADPVNSLGYVQYKTSNYWLRNYGNSDTTGCIVTSEGFAQSRPADPNGTWVSLNNVGVRPCCKVDLTKYKIQ